MIKLKRMLVASGCILTVIGVTACAVIPPIGKMSLVNTPPSFTVIDNKQTKPVKVTAVLTGWVEAPAFILMDQKNENTPNEYQEPQWVPSIAYIVSHPSQGNVIIDFGLKEGECAYGLKPFYWVPCRNDNSLNLASYLKDNENIRENIKFLIPSHLHGDHISGLPEVSALTSAPLLITDGALREMKSPWRDALGIPSKMLKVDMDVVSMTAQLAPDTVLGRAFDVFGDGSLKLFETPGHARGHVSAIARTETSTLILTFDASHLEANYKLQIPSGSVRDNELAFESLNQLKDIAAAYKDSFIVFGHDPSQWRCSENIRVIDKVIETAC